MYAPTFGTLNCCYKTFLVVARAFNRFFGAQGVCFIVCLIRVIAYFAETPCHKNESVLILREIDVTCVIIKSPVAFAEIIAGGRT